MGDKAMEGLASVAGRPPMGEARRGPSPNEDGVKRHGGEAGIRTLGGVTPTTVFETVPFNHSGTSPRRGIDTVFLSERQQF